MNFKCKYSISLLLLGLKNDKADYQQEGVGKLFKYKMKFLTETLPKPYVSYVSYVSLWYASQLYNEIVCKDLPLMCSPNIHTMKHLMTNKIVFQSW